MYAKNCRERILRLKKHRIDNGLTVDQCIELCGGFPSESTTRKIYAKGSEEKATFKESTIAAVELAVMGEVYSADISIPVEDVARSLADAIQPYAKENRELKYKNDQQSHIIKGLLALCIGCVAFFGGIAFYDFRSHTSGFWGTSSSPVWIVKVLFLLFVAGVIFRQLYALYQLKARFEKEDQEQNI